MDVLMIILRIIHILAGILWVGGGIFMLFFIAPTVKSLGAQGGQFMLKMFTDTPLDKLFPAVSLLTTLSGVWMYWKVSDGFDADWMSSAPGMVLSIGVVAGLAAFGHGGATLGRATGKMIDIGQQLAKSSGAPDPALVAEQQETQAYVQKHSQIGVILMVIAVLGMASARYF